MIRDHAEAVHRRATAHAIETYAYLLGALKSVT